MGKLIEAMERFERDYVKPPIMTTREAKDNVWLYNQLKDAGFLNTGMRKLNLDTKYWACSKEEFEGWIKTDNIWGLN